MDPLSAISGVLGVLDVSIRLGKYIKSLLDGANEIRDELTALLNEVEACKASAENIQSYAKRANDVLPGTKAEDAALIMRFWADLNDRVAKGKPIVLMIEKLMKEIEGKDGPVVKHKWDALRKAFRKDNRDESIGDYRQRLTIYQGYVSQDLQVLSMTYDRVHQETTLAFQASTTTILRQIIAKQEESVKSDLKAEERYKELRDIGMWVRDFLERQPTAPVHTGNQEFHISQPVQSIFTGRIQLLKDLMNDYEAALKQEDDRSQKRFVIYGLGGSGKTQFCSKFAQDNRQKFWGVFSVDATSPATLDHTFAKIAKIGGVEPAERTKNANMRAAKDWLANLQNPWLLIIDNADTPPGTRGFDIQDCFPGGERGLILVTTRVSAYANQGTFGKGYYNFEELDAQDANDLVLKAANVKRPWTSAVTEPAALIARTLGYLPLALLHAGKTILSEVCTLGEYVDFYKVQFSRIRRERRRSKLLGEDEEDSDMTVYTTYELMYAGLASKNSETSRDARDLLQTFSFFYWENIGFDMLQAAATNPAIEEQADKEDDAKAQKLPRPPAPPKALGTRVQEFLTNMILPWFDEHGPPAVPRVLRNSPRERFDVIRLRRALRQLVQIGIIRHDDTTDAYAIHRLVHTWIRERPEISISEQAAWCHTATMTLSCSILLRPPTKIAIQDEKLKRDVLPHIDHVRVCRKEIKERLMEVRQERHWRTSLVTLLLTPLPVSRSRGMATAKFGIAYFQSGYWEKAQAILEPLTAHLRKYLPIEHIALRRALLLLSMTYSVRAQTTKAYKIQKEVLDSCRRVLGENDLATLKIKDIVANNCQLRSQLAEATRLHDEAIAGMETWLGPDHEYTLLAYHHKGTTEGHYLRHTEARDWQEKAMTGMTKILGPEHSDTLFAKQSLSTAWVELGENLEKAHEAMEYVLEQRIKRHGREHPFTLMAILFLAMAKNALNQTDEALQLLLDAKPIAEVVFGPTHLGTLMGYVKIAEVLIHKGDYDQAESYLLLSISRQKFKDNTREDGEHSDRIWGLWILIRCYAAQGRIEDALRVCDEMTEALEKIGSQGLGMKHPIAKMLEVKQRELEGLRERAGRKKSEVDSLRSMPSPPPPYQAIGESFSPSILHRSSTFPAVWGTGKL